MTPAEPLVTDEVIRVRLGFDFMDDSAALELMAEEAQGIILNYIGGIRDPEWTKDTVPPTIRSAILLAIARLYDMRSGAEGEVLTPAIKSLLRRYRKPVIA